MQVQTIPLFVQIAETIKSRIFNQEYGPGDPVPSARELEDEFNVSNITVRRAMELLSQKGYIVPRRGMRARVASQIDDVVEIEITGDFKTWVDMAVGRKLKIVAEMLDRQVIDCPKAIGKILSLGAAEKVERIRRIRKLKETPVSYYVNYGPSRLLTKLSSRKIKEDTFIETFQDVCKINLKFMEQRVRATSADMDLADILKVDFGFPLFFVQNVYYSEKEIPLVVTHMYYRSDHYVYTVKKNLQ